MGDTGPFAVGASVLVPHTDRFYEAKVLKAQKREDGQWYYLIHYIGWNKKWDEWVEQTGLQPASEAAALNLQPPAKAAKQKGSAGGAAAAAAAAAWQRSKASVDGAAVQAGELRIMSCSLSIDTRGLCAPCWRRRKPCRVAL
jgi:mortality factor 4-like protein 1